jgi:Arc/MetJ-type ribon-helix-helix transcriptional regulator
MAGTVTPDRSGFLVPTGGSKMSSMAGMKVSVSLPAEDLAYIDEYAQRVGAPSRSSVLHQAVALLRMSELEAAYAAAFQEWQESEDKDLWEDTASDGLN